MQEKIWEYRSEQLKSADITEFAKTLGIPPVIAAILLGRGIDTDKKALSFLKKSLEGVHNPFMLNDMEEATERIISAISAKEKITIYGDYDVDGITSTAILYKFLKSVGADADYYIPDRNGEGYGVNIMAVNRIARRGTKLMITVDCGITAVGEVEFAKTQRMDVIVTDHHTCKDELPRAVAVINPKREDSTYPFDGLAGVGVAFKLVLALAIKLGKTSKEVFFEYADLAALGTIADVVPLVDENRTIADKGIKALANTKNNGIRALLAVSGLEGKPLDSTAVAFSLSPRLNVAGRLEHAKIAVELLTEENYERALEIAQFLNDTNHRRQSIEREIFEEALSQAESFEGEQFVYVLNREGWENGVIGIAASRICERFYRPCILISCEGGKGKGSGRSIEELNLFEALANCEDLLSAFGGHTQAAGLSIEADKIDEFRIKINSYAKKILENKTLLPKIRIDCPLKSESITLNTAKTLALLEPFGQGCENPVFSADNMKVLAAAKMGAENQHLRLRLSSGGQIFTAVGFGMGGLDIKEGEVVKIAFTMNINIYQGSENLQLMLKDIKR